MDPRLRGGDSGRMKIIKADKVGIALAVEYLRDGKAVAYPTDTAYGLGVDATNAAAVRRLYKIKGRNYKKPTHVIAHNFSAAKKRAMVDARTAGLMKKFWPGPLTLVLPMNRRATKAIKLLSAGTGSIGIRMPDNKIALELAKKLGRPITTPSANPQGGPAPYSIRDCVRQFKNRKHQPDLYLDAGKLPKTPPSTIVRIENSELRMVRRGKITEKQIQNALFFQKNQS